MGDSIDRAIEMLKIAAKWIRENSGYFGETTEFYDGAECDGSCIADDCENAADAMLAERSK